MSTVSKARLGGQSFAAGGKRVRITIGNGSRVEAMRGQLVRKRANWIIHSDILSYMEFLIQQRRRTNGGIDRYYGTCCRLPTSPSIPT